MYTHGVQLYQGTELSLFKGNLKRHDINYSRTSVTRIFRSKWIHVAGKKKPIFACYVPPVTRRRKISRLSFPFCKPKPPVFQLTMFHRIMRLNVLLTKDRKILHQKGQGPQMTITAASILSNTSFRISTTNILNGHSPFSNQRPSNTPRLPPVIYFAFS